MRTARSRHEHWQSSIPGPCGSRGSRPSRAGPGDVEVGRRSVFVALPRSRTVLVVDPRTGATAAARTPLAPARLTASDSGIWLLEPRTRRVALLGSDIVHRAPEAFPGSTPSRPTGGRSGSPSRTPTACCGSTQSPAGSRASTTAVPTPSSRGARGASHGRRRGLAVGLNPVSKVPGHRPPGPRLAHRPRDWRGHVTDQGAGAYQAHSPRTPTRFRGAASAAATCRG